VASGGRFSEDANDELVRLAGPDLLARSRLGTEIALQRIRDDPLGIAALAVRKQDTLWGTEHYGVQYGIRQSLADRPQHPDATTPPAQPGLLHLVPLAATAGVWLVRRRPDASCRWRSCSSGRCPPSRPARGARPAPCLRGAAALPLAALALVTLGTARPSVAPFERP
jgi:hypothetical protein